MENIMSGQSQFKQTKLMFEGFIGSQGNISYEEWASKPESMRAAILFVNFYDQITLAWYKVRGEHTYEEDGVDEAMHICSKLCGLSTKQPTAEKANCGCVITIKTYTPAYIFNAMRNAFKSLNYERRCTRSDYRHEDAEKRGDISVQSQYFTDANGDEQDLFSSVGDRDSIESVLDREAFWGIIEGHSEDVETVIMELLKYDRDVVEARRVASKGANEVKLSALEKAKNKREKYRRDNARIINMIQNSLSQFAEI